jgi:hypothetical protein
MPNPISSAFQGHRNCNKLKKKKKTLDKGLTTIYIILPQMLHISFLGHWSVKNPSKRKGGGVVFFRVKYLFLLENNNKQEESR